MGFLNAAFLFAFVAAAVPIVIHLLNRRRVKRVKFSSLEFLDEVNRQRMRRIHLRRILILILRTLAVLAIVTAFARPTLRSGFLFAGSVPKNVVVCLDASYSMGLSRENGTAFDAAKTIARTVVDDAGSGDLLHVVRFGRQADVLLDRGTRNKGVVKSTIDRIPLSHETTSLRSAIERSIAVIEQSEVEGGEIVVISDFRFNEDSTVVNEAKLPEKVRIYFVAVHEDEADNVSIDRVAVPRKLVRPGEVVKVMVTATNHAARTPASVPLEVIVDGDRKAEQVIELAPRASQTVSFALSMSEPGRYHGRVAKNHDRLAVDDDRFFLLDISKSIPVAVVSGRRSLGGASAGAPATFYVEKALNPRGTAGGEFDVKVADERDVTAAALPAGGVVVWLDPQKVDPRRLALIDRHVRRGGGLLVFLGDAPREVIENAAFRALLGMRGGTVKGDAPRAAFTSFESGHPVFNLFTKEELQLLSRAKVRTYTAARGVAPDSVIAHVGGGDPAVWECARGRGRVLVFAASPDLVNGDIPLSPMFLPLVHTAVTYLASTGEAPGADEHYVGSRVDFDLAQRVLDESQLSVRDPAGTTLRPVVGTRTSGDVSVGLERPEQVGFYRLYRDTTRVAEVAVNLDARESNLGVSSLPDKRPEGVSVVKAGSRFRSDLRQAKEGREIYAAFIMVALAALVAESVLGRKG